MLMATEKRRVVVDLGLDERAGGRLIEGKVVTRTRHARTRFVIDRPGDELPDRPVPGELWSPLTVRARLHRMAEVYRRLPHDPDTRPGTERCSMPTPVREYWKDEPASTFVRHVVSQADQAAARQVLDSLVGLWREPETLMVVWAIAIEKMRGRPKPEDLLKALHMSDRTLRRRKLEVLDELVRDWNGNHRWRPDLVDCAKAYAFIHRNVDR